VKFLKETIHADNDVPVHLNVVELNPTLCALGFFGRQMHVISQLLAGIFIIAGVFEDVFLKVLLSKCLKRFGYYDIKGEDPGLVLLPLTCDFCPPLLAALNSLLLFRILNPCRADVFVDQETGINQEMVEAL
jgi:hypothetical protein